MILTKEVILREIERGRIKIDPFDPESVGPASIDLSLGKEIRVFMKVTRPIPVDEETSSEEITEKRVLKGGYLIEPYELALCITKETITLPDDICGWLGSRSRFARLGLMVHVTAPFVQPGVSNKQVLEMFNAGPNKLVLIPGKRLCQLILERCEGAAHYEGKFRSQEI